MTRVRVLAALVAPWWLATVTAWAWAVAAHAVYARLRWRP